MVNNRREFLKIVASGVATATLPTYANSQESNVGKHRSDGAAAVAGV